MRPSLQTHAAIPAIMVVENRVSPPLSCLLQQAGITAQLIVMADAEAAASYLEEIAGEDREGRLPMLGLWDVTLPAVGIPETAAWLQTPQPRQIIIADLRGNGLHRELGAGIGFGEDGALLKFDSAEALVRAFGEWRDVLLSDAPGLSILRAA
ncbi:MAG TPA: hypothetical protein VFB72_16915 [Verrucomicrobiae bacterium]|nr:hypothetical protein [Verrucomicrobiae bacterium]